MKLPIALPDGWTAEDIVTHGTVIEAPDEFGKCFVTVDEKVRNFKLGMSTVYERGDYTGHGWKVALYNDAVAALQAVIGWPERST